MPYDPTGQTKIKKSGTGRLAVLPKISTYQAKQNALHMIRRGRMKPYSKLYNVIGLLGATGVLPERNMIEMGMVTNRTLNRYRKDAILDVVPTPPLVEEILRPKRLWGLGAVGLQLAKLQFDLVPTGYLESKIDTISHDVLCNCLYTQLYRATKETDLTAILSSKYEANLTDFRNMQILQPDGMITLKGSQKKGHFLLEYHNEESGTRAKEKVERYEHIRRNANWSEQWELKKFPPLLIVARRDVVKASYQKEIEEKEVACIYLYKSLEDVLGGRVLEWESLNSKEKVNLSDYMY